MKQAGRPENGVPIPLWPAGAPDLNPAWGDWAPTLTPFLIEAPAPRGLVIICPGGAYSGRAAHEGLPVAQWLNGEGFHSAVLDYRTQNFSNPLPLGTGPLRDARRAVRLARTRAGAWSVRPDRIALLGFSAGGHLAAMAGTQFEEGRPAEAEEVERASSRPDALVLCYPALLFHPKLHANLLGAEAPVEQFDAYSCERYVTAHTPPTFLWHTAEDAGVPAEHSLAMVAALRRHGVPIELHVFAKGRHGLGLADGDPAVAPWKALCARWLRESVDFG
jgi:acetyl esterase/lipase